MIITVTLNAALDKTLEVPNFTPGRRHRTVDQTTMPGGKGVNVARAIKRLGQPVIATGLAGGATGTRIVEALNDEAILTGFVRIREESRTNTVVDTDGEPLRLAVRAEPDVVSPNELEAEELVGHEFNDLDDRASAVAEMTRIGAAEAIMTVPDGCFAQVLQDGIPVLYRVRVTEQEARSTIGSGDAFLAGYVAARYSGRPPVQCLRYGVACGAESTQHFGAGLLDPGKVDRLIGEVEAERLEIGAEIR